MIIFGAGLVGEATLYAARAKGVPIECFIDDRVTGYVGGVPVLRTHEIGMYAPYIRFYLTSPNIEDMIRPLTKAGFDNWRSCGELLHGFDLSSVDWSHTPYSVDHVKYLVRTALHHHDNYLHPERLTVQSIDLIITERCSMKCRDCSNLMQYYERPENADLNEMLATIDAISERMDEIYEVRVIGGEPFMNKEWHLVVEKLNEATKVKKVSIFTNATIIPREHQWASLQHEKVRLFVTDYDELSRNIRPLVEELQKRGIAYVNEKANDWTDCASLEKHNRTRSENEALFEACCAKNLATLADGKLYRCPFSANADKLRAVPAFQQDWLQVERSSREDISRFLRGKTMIEACDHCNGRSYGDKIITPALQTAKPLTYHKYARA